MYILSGSSTPKDDSIHHNGAGRIACIEMESMTLQEMGFSSLKVSFNNLFTKDYIVKNGSFDFSNDYQNIQKNFEYLSKGGFPESFVQNYTEKECIEINTDYLKQICRLNKKDKSNNVLYTFSRTMMEKIITELARLTGQELNISKIADITGYSKETVIRYIDILENMFIIKKLYC
jgi:predicted AAA+ superfamily ATPase